MAPNLSSSTFGGLRLTREVAVGRPETHEGPALGEQAALIANLGLHPRAVPRLACPGLSQCYGRKFGQFTTGVPVKCAIPVIRDESSQDKSAPLLVPEMAMVVDVFQIGGPTAIES